MAVLYWRPPSAEDLANAPWYTIADYPEPDCDVWDENWLVLNLYMLYSNQWRMSTSGPAGLDMTVFHHALDRKGISEHEYDDWIKQLSIIEREALRQMMIP